MKIKKLNNPITETDYAVIIKNGKGKILCLWKDYLKKVNELLKQKNE